MGVCHSKSVPGEATQVSCQQADGDATLGVDRSFHTTPQVQLLEHVQAAPANAGAECQSTGSNPRQASQQGRHDGTQQPEPTPPAVPSTHTLQALSSSVPDTGEAQTATSMSAMSAPQPQASTPNPPASSSTPVGGQGAMQVELKGQALEGQALEGQAQALQGQAQALKGQAFEGQALQGQAQALKGEAQALKGQAFEGQALQGQAQALKGEAQALKEQAFEGRALQGQAQALKGQALVARPTHNSPQRTPAGAAAGAGACTQLLLDAPRPAADVTQRGVDLAYLLLLVEHRLLDPTWTIQQVVDNFVRPRSQASLCCLYSMIPEQYTGPPVLFVSHTWSRKLGDLLHLLQGHLARHHVQHAKTGEAAEGPSGLPLLWLDIVAINQHPYEARGCLLGEDVAALARVVAATEATLFCLDKDCVILTRIWCLYEVWHTFLSKGVQGLRVLMPVVEADRLRQLFEEFDVMRANATQLQDRDLILDQIGRSIGPTALNLQLKQALVGSALREVEHSAGYEGVQLAEVLEKAATLLHASGEAGEGEGMYRRALQQWERACGPQHCGTLHCTVGLAACLRDQGREALRPEAQALYRQAAELYCNTLGPSSEEALEALQALVGMLIHQDKYSEAEPLCRRVVEGRIQALGAGHLSVVEAQQQLEACLVELQRDEEAGVVRDAIHEAVLAALNDLPRVNPDLETLWQVARALDESGMYFEADDGDVALDECLYRQALELMRSKQGPIHPDTIACLEELANCIGNQDRWRDAVPLLREALEAWRRVLGDRHPQTADAMVGLADALEQARVEVEMEGSGAEGGSDGSDASLGGGGGGDDNEGGGSSECDDGKDSNHGNDGDDGDDSDDGNGSMESSGMDGCDSREESPARHGKDAPTGQGGDASVSPLLGSTPTGHGEGDDGTEHVRERQAKLPQPAGQDDDLLRDSRQLLREAQQVYEHCYGADHPKAKGIAKQLQGMQG